MSYVRKKKETQQDILVVCWATRPSKLVAQHLFMVVPGVRTPDLSSPGAPYRPKSKDLKVSLDGEEPYRPKSKDLQVSLDGGAPYRLKNKFGWWSTMQNKTY